MRTTLWLRNLEWFIALSKPFSSILQNFHLVHLAIPGQFDSST